MSVLRSGLLLATIILLGACNAVISEQPVFTEADPSGPQPRDGLWIAEDADCAFDAAQQEASWPECAMWLVIRDRGAEARILDGKGQSERVSAIFIAGTPTLVQGMWIDEVKEPPRLYYAFFAIEPGPVDQGGRFTRASAWLVECGVQEQANAELRPFPGITGECRPTSSDAIRSAAAASRRARSVAIWRWIR